jgi:hypothetical protein
MKFTDRREFLYDPDIFKKSDVQTALKLNEEFIRKMSGNPPPKFFEIDRRSGAVDKLWGEPVGDRKQYTRLLEIPAIVQFDKLSWGLNQKGRQVKQRVKFWLSNLQLQKSDYFPLPGDFILWNGYRVEITSFDFEPNSYWQQTNVWLAIIVVAEIVPDGDLKPVENPARPVPAERASGFVEVAETAGKLVGKETAPEAEFYGRHPDSVVQDTSYQVVPPAVPKEGDKC